MSGPPEDAPALDVLVPTSRRPAALAVTLTSLTAPTLPEVHCGEDVLAQTAGGAAVRRLRRSCRARPTTLQLPTTVEDRSCDAPRVLSGG